MRSKTTFRIASIAGALVLVGGVTIAALAANGSSDPGPSAPVTVASPSDDPSVEPTETPSPDDSIRHHDDAANPTETPEPHETPSPDDSIRHHSDDDSVEPTETPSPHETPSPDDSIEDDHSGDDSGSDDANHWGDDSDEGHS